METIELAELTTRVRSGDVEAAAEFVRRFELQIRRAIRVRSTGQMLQRVLDSDDLCQSVLRRFLGQVGNPDLPTEDPARLLGWLLKVARNRHREALRRTRAARRGGGRLRELGPGQRIEPVDPSPPVGQELEQRELLGQILAQLGEQERQIAQWRADGVSWEEIARNLGRQAEAVRKNYRRAISRVVNG